MQYTAASSHWWLITIDVQSQLVLSLVWTRDRHSICTVLFTHSAAEAACSRLQHWSWLQHCRGERPLQAGAAARSVNRPVQYKQRVNCVNCVKSGGPAGRTARIHRTLDTQYLAALRCCFVSCDCGDRLVTARTLKRKDRPFVANWARSSHHTYGSPVKHEYSSKLVNAVIHAWVVINLNQLCKIYI